MKYVPGGLENVLSKFVRAKKHNLFYEKLCWKYFENFTNGHITFYEIHFIERMLRAFFP